MKVRRRQIAIIAGLGICFLAIGLLALSLLIRLTRLSEHDRASRLIQTALDRNVQLIEYYDDHGGFHGDGSTWIVFAFSPEEQSKFIQAIRRRTDWHQLPLAQQLQKLGRILQPDGDTKLPTRLSHGYYYFHDFQPEWYPDYEDTRRPVHDRSSYNFVVAIFDVENHMLYIYNLDT